MLKFSLNKQILHTSESVMKGCSGGDMRVCVCVCVCGRPKPYMSISYGPADLVENFDEASKNEAN